MKKITFTILLAVGFSMGLHAQNLTEGRIQKKYFIDYVMGPYLLIDNLQYDALMMNGARFGIQFWDSKPL